MKRLTTIAWLLAFFSFFSQAQNTLYFSEEFSNGFNGDSTNGIANGVWTTYGISNFTSNSNAIWEYRGPNTVPNTSIGSRGAHSGNSPIDSPTASNGFALFDSDFLDNNGVPNALATGIAPAPHKSWLVSPVFNTTGSTGLYLEFSTYFAKYQATGMVLLSNDSGQTWGDTVHVFDQNVPINYFSDTQTVISEPIHYLSNTQNACIAFFFDGHQPRPGATSAYYHFMVDDILIFQAPNNDLSLESNWLHTQFDTSLFNYYSMVPNDIAKKDTITFTSYIRNKGVLNQTNTKITQVINTPTGLSVLSSLPVTLASDSYDSLTISPKYVADQGIGSYVWSINVSSDSIDDNPLDNYSDTLSFLVTDTTLARDFNASNDVNISNGNTYEIGNVFHLPDTTVISSITIQIGSSTIIGSVIGLHIYDKTDLTTPLQSKYISLTSNQIGSPSSFSMPLTLSPGSYFTSIAAYDTGIYLAATEITPPWNTAYIQPSLSGTWFYANQTPVIRMNIQSTSSTCTLNSNVSLLNGISCFGDSTANITVNTTGGASPFIYSWSNGNQSANNSNLMSGVYYVTISDSNNCVINDSIQITQPDSLQPNISISQAISCYGDSNGTLISIPIGGTSPFSYQWSNNTSTANNTNLAKGWYMSTVTDANSCITVDSIYLPEPSILSSSVTKNHDNICLQVNDGNATATASGGVTPYNYTWSNNGLGAQNDSLVVGWNYLTVTDSNLCSVLDSIEIFLTTIPPLNIGSDTMICLNSSFSISSNGNYTSYVWSDGSTSSTVQANTNVPDTLMYTLQTTNSPGCTLFDTIQVIVRDTYFIEITGGQNLCAYEAATLGVNSSYSSYVWNTTETNSTLQVNANTLPAGPHFYGVTVTDSYGCQSSDTAQLDVYPEVLVDLGYDTIFWDAQTAPNTYTLDPGSGYSSYLWMDGTTQQTMTLVDSTWAGLAYVEVTDSNGCVGSDSISVIWHISVEELEVGTIKLFPNPADDFVTLGFSDLPTHGEYTLTIYSISGALISQEKAHLGSTSQKQFDVSALPAGTYFMQIQSKKVNTTILFNLK